MAAQPIRVLHVIWSIDPAKGSGPGDALRALSLEQARTGVKVSIVTADTPADIQAVATPLREAGVTVHSIGPVHQFLTIGRTARDALRDVFAGGMDVAHIHGMWQHPLHTAAVEAHRAGVPYIIRGAGMLDSWAMDQGRLKKKLHLALVSGRDLRRARAFHATAYPEARNFAKLDFKTPVAVVAHGIEFADRQPARRDPEANTRWPAIKGFRRLLFLGRIDPVKGTVALAEAWGRVAPDFPDWRLVMAGPDWGGHKSEFEESLAARNVLDKTVFVGTVRGNDKRILLSSCDLFVQPSLQENFGITIAEALAAGRPVITTKGTPWQVLPVRGAGWWIDHGATPLEHALREAMSMDQAALDEMGRKGPWIIEERSSWPRVAVRLNAVYTWMLECDKAPDYVYRSKADMPEGWGTGATGRAVARDRRRPTSILPSISLPLVSPQTSDMIVRYGLTIAIVALAALIRWSVSHWVGDRVSLFMAYAATAVITLLCGVRAGLIALLLGYFVNTLLFVSPHGLVPTNAVDAVKVGFYVGAGLVTCALAAWLRRREEQAQEREWAAEDKIAAQAADLARSNAELERFAQLVAKDLKEPLRGIATNSRRLLEAHTQALSSPARQLALTMDRQARRGISIVDAVLELSLAGRDLQLAEVDLNSVLDDVTEDLREMIDEEHAQVVVDRLPAVTCDRVQVLRVLEILIKNAIMYNKNPAKRIEIGTSPRASANQPPTIYVRDNGVGIAPEDREHVFELFSRVQAHADFGGGSGTGLAMVKKLVQSHGGVVWVESRVGEGSTFYFTLGRNGHVD